MNIAITRLNLRHNSIGDEGCAALTEALKMNTAVADVDLSYNSTCDAGCAALSEALKVNTAVSDVYLKQQKQYRRRRVCRISRSPESERCN